MGNETLYGITQETIDMTRQIVAAGIQNLGHRLPTTEKAGGKDITVASNCLSGILWKRPQRNSTR